MKKFYRNIQRIKKEEMYDVNCFLQNTIKYAIERGECSTQFKCDELKPNYIKDVLNLNDIDYEYNEIDNLFVLYWDIVDISKMNIKDKIKYYLFNFDGWKYD